MSDSNTTDSTLQTHRVDLLLHHTHLIKVIAKLLFLEFGYMNPRKTLDDFVQGLQSHCNDRILPMTYVAIQDQDFLGTFSLRKCDLASHSHFMPWIGSVFVPPEKRNQGLGAALTREAESTAKAMGYDKLHLFTPTKATWYAKLGWTTVEVSELNNIPITIMQKLL